VAVLAVVGFHAAVPGVGGGYVGVDVFYVISGYLITGLLWREISTTGRLELARFYARRARRLLPAATLVSIATIIAAACWLPPLRAREVLGDALAAACYVGNYRLAIHGTDYLAAGQPPSPFQHYWSLAVEEQFYLAWPLLLLAAVWLGRRRAAAVLALGLVATGSFWLSLDWTTRLPAWAFFSLPSRAWELAVGGLLALAGDRLTGLPRRLAMPLGLAGLATLLGSCVLLGPTTAFPGTAALYPVLGTAAVIAGGCPAGRIGPSRLLGVRPLRVIGRLSYSWYLWHWPVLLFVPELVGHPLGLAGRLLAALVALGLATLTLVGVEAPVRGAGSLSRWPRRGLLMAASLTCASVLAVLLTARSLPDLAGHGVAATPALGADAAAVAGSPFRPSPSVLNRLTAQVQQALDAALRTERLPANLRPSLARAAGDKATPFLDGCLSSWTAPEPSNCFYADTGARSTVLLMGDSHAAQWFPALDGIASRHRLRLQVLGKSACPPLRMPVFSPYLGRPYTECGQWLSQAIADVRALRPRLVVLDVARHYSADYHFAVYSPQWYAGLAETVREVRAAGAPVLVLGAIPKPPSDVPSCLSAHLDSVQRCTVSQAASLSAAGMSGERTAVLAAGGQYFDLSTLLCSTGRCPVIVGNVLVYRDDNHLTPEYASWLAPVLSAEVDRVLRVQPH
jgi:peptidoglycan/LPS O-acetylase OafA/YrhL